MLMKFGRCRSYGPTFGPRDLLLWLESSLHVYEVREISQGQVTEWMRIAILLLDLPNQIKDAPSTLSV